MIIRNRICIAVAAPALVVSLAACGSKAKPAASTASGGASTASTSASSKPTESTTSGALSDSFYPYAQGSTWKYTTEYPGLGTVEYTETVESMTDSGSDKKAHIVRSFHYVSGKAKDFTMPMDYVIHPDGSIDTPYQPTQVAGVTVTVKAGKITLPSPADLEAGKESSGKIEATTTIAGQDIDETIDFTMKGAGHESVTVPAGTYDALKVNQALSITMSVVDTKTNVETTSYFGKGVGMVKSVVKGGQALPTGGTSSDIVTELVSYTHG